MAILAWKCSSGIPTSSKFAVCERKKKEEENWILEPSHPSGVSFLIKATSLQSIFLQCQWNSEDGGGMMVNQRRLSSWLELFLAPSEYWWESMCAVHFRTKPDSPLLSRLVFSEIEEQFFFYLLSILYMSGLIFVALSELNNTVIIIKFWIKNKIKFEDMATGNKKKFCTLIHSNYIDKLRCHLHFFHK